MSDWPLRELVLRCRAVELSALSEDEVAELAAQLPSDLALDPSLEGIDGLDPAADRRVRFLRGHWRAQATWTPEDWVLHLGVRHDGRLVGVQTLEGSDFLRLRTIDSASWLVPQMRGKGLGTAMRMAVLGLAFDHLGALAALSSATVDNAASLGVSRRLGYLDNGIGFVNDDGVRRELQMLRLPAARWRHGGEVTVSGFERCRPWFGLGR